MPIQLVAPDVAVNTDNIESVYYTENTDAHKERHVIINFRDFGYELPPDYTLPEILAALDGKCYYRSEYSEMVGDLDVCVLHGNNSKYSEAEHGKYRLCLTVNPYVTYNNFPYDFVGKRHKPDITQSWEYRKKELDEKALREAERVLDGWVGNDDPKPPTPPDMTPYDQRPDYKRSFWKRMMGL